jgi:hypothetical protein
MGINKCTEPKGPAINNRFNLTSVCESAMYDSSGSYSNSAFQPVAVPGVSAVVSVFDHTRFEQI